jgi:hypothetical protein
MPETATRPAATEPRADTDSGELKRMIRGQAEPRTISAYLDQLPEPSRIAASRSLDGRLQRALYAMFEGVLALRLRDVVPEHVPDLTPVRHFGRNSMPLFTHFEKRFYRISGNTTELAGANFHALQPLTGPGYYMAVEDLEHGELLVDYRRVPAVAPQGFLPIAPNTGLRNGTVFGNLIDRVRRVSEHVSIGSASKQGKELGSYFTLCRQERTQGAP